MPFFDMPLEQLQTYSPKRDEPADFDAFWQRTLVEARQHALDAHFEPYDAGLELIDCYDVTFSGYGGQRVKGWYMRPREDVALLPCVVQFIGYGGGRGFPQDWLLWPTAGYAAFVMDTRGQGSVWRNGDTPDLPDGANSSYPGFMTQGVLDPQTYYYRRVFTDAVRAVEAVISRQDVDKTRIAVLGGSQGGAISIAAAGLLPADVALCLPDVPFLCHFRRAVGLTESHPYQELALYLKTHRDKEQTVFTTLNYFDGMHFAARIKAESYFSTALMDTICPPSTVFAAYNQVNAPKSIEVYRFNDHEGGQTYQQIKQLHWINERWR